MSIVSFIHFLHTLGFHRSHEALAVEPPNLSMSVDLAHLKSPPQPDPTTGLFLPTIDQDTWQELFWSWWQSLTRREQEVAALICMNLSNEEIANELHVSISTVKAHVHHILHKLAARNRTHLQHMLSGWDFKSWYEKFHSSEPANSLFNAR
jgi:DNA-binding NarL/FixJ family response regulator